ESAEEAYFIAGLLNSAPARLALWCSSVGVQTQRYFPTDVSRVRLPELKASDKTQLNVTRLSEECHSLAARGDWKAVALAEEELNHAVAGVWEITAKELDGLLVAYEEVKGFRAASPTEEEDGADEAQDDHE